MKSEPSPVISASSGASSTEDILAEPTKADFGSELQRLYPEAFQRTDSSQIKFRCGEGWLAIIRTLCSLLAEANRHEAEQPTYLTDAIEKLGTLRILVSGRSQVAQEWIRFASQHSANVCEICGCSARLIYTDGWQRVRCDAHTSSPVPDLID